MVFPWEGGKYANVCNRQIHALVHTLTIFDICKDKKHEFQLSRIEPIEAIIMLYFVIVLYTA